MNYLSNENKGLLWSILQESDIFNNIPDNKFNSIKQMFENTMLDISKKMNNNNLMEQNKYTIETLMSKINADKRNYNNEFDSSKLKVVYRAQDIQKERNAELNLKLEEHINNMNTIINPKKPMDINFADTTYDDKPIGDSMDRLISELLASRERELDIPMITPEGDKWLNTSSNTMIDPNKSTHNDKHVSFNTIISEEITQTENTTSPSVTNLLNKIKKKVEPAQIIMNLQSDENETENMSIHSEIKYLIKKQDSLIAEHIELKNRLNTILNKI